MKPITEQKITKGVISKLPNYVSFSARRKFLESQGLTFLGAGTSRDVYDLHDGRVIKLAFNKKGIEQNKFEAKAYKTFNAKHIFAKVFYSHPEGLWSVCEKVTPFDNIDDFERATGLDYDLFRQGIKHCDVTKNTQRAIKNMLSMVDAEIEKFEKFQTRSSIPLTILDTMRNKKSRIEKVADNPLFTNICNLSKELEENMGGDISKPDSYGVTDDGYVVLVDFGMSHHAWSYYEGSNQHNDPEVEPGEETEFGHPVPSLAQAITP
jgi:hypothetical protein